MIGVSVGSVVLGAALVGVWQVGGIDLGELEKSPVHGALVDFAGESLYFRTLERGVYGPWLCATAVLARDSKDWVEGMSNLGASCLEPEPPPPAVDWQSRMVILVAMGERPTTGYEVQIREVRQDGSLLVIDVEESSPTDEFKQQTMTAPFHLIEMERLEVTRVRVNAVVPTSTRDVSWGQIKDKY